jgi:hypothetical protein
MTLYGSYWRNFVPSPYCVAKCIQSCWYFNFFLTGATSVCGSQSPPWLCNSTFYPGLGSLAPRPALNQEDQWLLFIWPLSFNPSGMDYLQVAYAPASIAGRVIVIRRPLDVNGLALEDVGISDLKMSICFLGSSVSDCGFQPVGFVPRVDRLDPFTERQIWSLFVVLRKMIWNRCLFIAEVAVSVNTCYCFRCQMQSSDQTLLP